MLSGNETSRLNRRSPWKKVQEMTVTSGLVTRLWGFSSPCRDVPSAVGPGVCGAGAGGRTTMGNVGFDASELNVGAKVLMVLPGLGA